MKSVKNIVFLGMMGSGKTTIGSLVSKKLNLNFFDIDEYIETKIGEKISKIFNKKGEKYFRDIEEKATLEILKKKKYCNCFRWGCFYQCKYTTRSFKKSYIFLVKT